MSLTPMNNSAKNFKFFLGKILYLNVYQMFLYSIPSKHLEDQSFRSQMTYLNLVMEVLFFRRKK